MASRRNARLRKRKDHSGRQPVVRVVASGLVAKRSARCGALPTAPARVRKSNPLGPVSARIGLPPCVATTGPRRTGRWTSVAPGARTNLLERRPADMGEAGVGGVDALDNGHAHIVADHGVV